jgi:hypothetical protein
MMSFFETANVSSPFHEFAHHALNIYDKLSDTNGTEEWVKRDFETVLKEFGYTKEQFRGDENAARDVHERFARGFEVYAATGEAPNETLQSVFENLKKWLVEIYKDIKADLGIELSDDLREVYDRLLSASEEINAEHKRRQELRERVETGRATVSDLREMQSQIARNAPERNNSLLKKSIEIMLDIENEPNDCPVSKYSGQKMLEILEKSIEQKKLQEQGKTKEKPESLTR